MAAADRSADVGDPVFPLVGMTRLVVDVDQRFLAEWASPALPLQEPEPGPVQRGTRMPPGGPVVGQAGSSRRRPALDQRVPGDRGPGELEQVGTAVRSPNTHRSRLVALNRRSTGTDPVLRLVRMRIFRPLVGELPHVVVQLVEHPGGHRMPVVGRPPRMIGLSRMRTACALCPRSALISALQPCPDPFHRRLARFDQQLAAVAADVESQEVHPVIEVDDAGLVFVEGQPPGRQPRGQLGLDLLGLLTGVTQGERVIGVPDRRPGSPPRRSGIAAGGI